MVGAGRNEKRRNCAQDVMCKRRIKYMPKNKKAIRQKKHQNKAKVKAHKIIHSHSLGWQLLGMGAVLD